MKPCENPAYNPCNGEAGYQCWYEACGDDDSTLCNISCRQDDMASIKGTIEVGIDTVTPSGSKNGIPGNTAGDSVTVTIPGVYPVPSLEELTNGGMPVVPTNSTSGGSTCPDGNPPVNCVFDPCAATTCLVGTVCVSNYCGGALLSVPKA
jgi:hypothetical protein